MILRGNENIFSHESFLENYHGKEKLSSKEDAFDAYYDNSSDSLSKQK